MKGQIYKNAHKDCNDDIFNDISFVAETYGKSGKHKKGCKDKTSHHTGAGGD